MLKIMLQRLVASGHAFVGIVNTQPLFQFSTLIQNHWPIFSTYMLARGISGQISTQEGNPPLSNAFAKLDDAVLLKSSDKF